jgi:hypothetical protein
MIGVAFNQCFILAGEVRRRARPNLPIRPPWFFWSWMEKRWFQQVAPKAKTLGLGPV